jgi:hypothetical protein
METAISNEAVADPSPKSEYGRWFTITSKLLEFRLKNERI